MDTRAEVLRLVQEGFGAAQIAAQLSISRQAVYKHINALRREGKLPEAAPEPQKTNAPAVNRPRGAPKGNHNAVTTGEYETLWDEGLSERERVAMRAAWELPALDQVHRQLGLLDVRIARALERIKQTRAVLAAGVEMALDSRVEELVGSERLTRVGARDTLVHQREILERQEASLDRMLQRRERLLALKVKIEALGDPDKTVHLMVDLL